MKFVLESYKVLKLQDDKNVTIQYEIQVTIVWQCVKIRAVHNSVILWCYIIS
jgi:hypothetical protein